MKRNNWKNVKETFFEGFSEFLLEYGSCVSTAFHTNDTCRSASTNNIYRSRDPKTSTFVPVIVYCSQRTWHCLLIFSPGWSRSLGTFSTNRLCTMATTIWAVNENMKGQELLTTCDLHDVCTWWVLEGTLYRCEIKNQKCLISPYLKK